MEYRLTLYLPDGSTVVTVYQLSMQAQAFANAKQYADDGKRFTLSLE